MLNVELLLVKKAHQVHKIHKNSLFLLKYPGFCSFIICSLSETKTTSMF